MPYKKGYFMLFNAITDAMNAMEEQNFGQAKAILCQAQIDAEEIYLRETDDEETTQESFRPVDGC